MRHLDEGSLRAYHDGALSEKGQEQVRAHLASCARCAQAAEAVRARGERVRSLLSGMDPLPVRHISLQSARRRFRLYAKAKEVTMVRNVFGRRYRMAWAALALVVICAIAFSFAPVRAAAGNLLALFRVKKIAVVEVNPAQLQDPEALKATMQQFEGVMQEQVTFEQEGEPQELDETGARSLSAFRVRLPEVLGGEARYWLRPAVHATIEVDLERIRAVLSELGYDGKQIPDALDGAEIRVDFYPVLFAAYGECDSDASGCDPDTDDCDPDANDWASAGGRVSSRCTILAQMPSPNISAPSELDLDQLGQAYLQVLGMSADEAARFSRRVEWTTTLVVPLPRSTNLGYRDVSVDGVEGTLVYPLNQSARNREYLLTWVKGDVIYALLGKGTQEDVIAIAESLR